MAALPGPGGRFRRPVPGDLRGSWMDGQVSGVSSAQAESSSMSAAKSTYELPKACCQAAHRGSRPAVPDGNHDWGAVAKMRRPAPAAASGSRARCQELRAARVSTAGTHHTQWCDQETGEISKVAKALSDSAQQSCDAANAYRIPRQASMTATADSASQAAVPSAVCGPRPARASAAWMHWLLG